ncbi:MAG: diguanylate cyclase [Legionella sp.]|nr:diguanylate cyclase [Legionella sp.]
MDSIQKKLDQLIKNYSNNLPGKIQGIEHLWDQLQKNWELAKFHDFHREVHSLCGSAGTYGYIELSKTAREMELFLKSILNVSVLTEVNRETITTLLNQLKSIASLELSLKMPLLETESEELIENKCVYIMEQEEALVQQLNDGLKQLGFNSYHISNIDILRMSTKEKPPVAMFIDTHYLNSTTTEIILNIQKESPTPIILFCILPNEEILPRLDAIRAGSKAFFQKPIDLPHLIQVFNQKCSMTSREAYRILIVDDSKSITDYYSLILKQAGMIVHAINNPLDLFKELEEFQPDLLLMDIYMPECTGLELAAVLRQESCYTKIPIIFLSTEEDKDKKLFAISLGVDDFLTKPISPQHLISAVRSRSKRANILNYYMTTDSLTGLLNHSSILKQLSVELARAKQAKVPLSFIMLDIDNFKKVNDQYGHPVGDLVIKKLATTLLTRLRGQDIVGRYGGEEFVLIMLGSTIEDSTNIVNNLRITFSKYHFIVENKEFYVTFSAGISCYDGSTDSSSLIVEQADQALYKAKQLGRNKVVVYT